MSFSTPQMTSVGVKGSDVYTATGVGDPRVALSALLTRGAASAVVQNGLRAILAMEDPKAIEDAFVLLFQTRDVRGGKGERAVADVMWRHMLSDPKVRAIAIELLALVPEYGCWRDLFELAEKPLPADARVRIYRIAVDQLQADELAVAEKKAPSLLAKWIPREDRMGAQAKVMALMLYPREERLSHRLAAYRKRVSALNRVLKTTEVKMCGGHWEEIEPARVPGRCLQKHMKAFLNECLKASRGSLRHPNDEARMACREHFQEHFAKAKEGKAKINGSKTVFPHELILKAFGTDKKDVDERNAILGIWRQMVADAKAGGGLGRSIAMCDFSGSMASSSVNGAVPLRVSMALGLLIAEVTTDEFKNTFLTFDSTPTLHKMRPEDDLFARLEPLGYLGQGTSTDFQKAMDLVLGELKAKRCRPGNEPENLIVLTDMGWDEAYGSDRESFFTGHSYRNVVKTAPWQTHIEMIRESFKRAGEDMWGEGQGFKMPRIVIWNIASTYTDFHAKADTEGVVMLSGWSPSLFKALQTEGPDGVKPMTPLEMLRLQLDDTRYDPVRECVRNCMAMQ